MLKKIPFIFLVFLSGCAVARLLTSPKDYGSLAAFEGTKPKVLLIPFHSFIIKDGKYRSTTDNYPSLEMSLWMYLRIRDNCFVLYPDSTRGHFSDTGTTEYEATRRFVNALMTSVLENPDSVHLWRTEAFETAVDTAALFYFPLNLERLRGDDYDSRFFTIIANSKGHIVFVRMIDDYKPGMWAKDYRHFAGDTRNRMPFGKWGF